MAFNVGVKIGRPDPSSQKERELLLIQSTPFRNIDFIVSSLFCNSGSLFQSTVTSVIYFCLGFSCCPYYWGVHYSGVSARRELSVFTHDYSSRTVHLPTKLCAWQQWVLSKKLKESIFLIISKWTVVHLVPVNPLSPNIHKQILQTDLYTFL